MPTDVRRYSIGTPSNSLKYDADGSLTIYAPDPLPKERRGNCLSAPKGADFSLFTGTYWPKVEITVGSWTLLAVVRVN